MPMDHSSTDIAVHDPIAIDTDGAETSDPSSFRVFRLNYLKELSWKIDIQQNRIDRLEALIDKVAGYKEAIAEIRSDPEGNGITRSERHEIHDLNLGLHHVEDRIDAMPDLDTMSDRLQRLEMDFIHKSDAWDLSI
jgi:hypothetical protein